MTWQQWWQLKLMDLEAWGFYMVPFWCFVGFIAWVATRKKP